jgi:hypothetical protein
LEYAIRGVKDSQEGLKFNVTYQLSLYPDDVNIVGKTDTIKKNTESLLQASKEVSLKVNPKKTKYTIYQCHVKRTQDKIMA